MTKKINPAPALISITIAMTIDFTSPVREIEDIEEEQSASAKDPRMVGIGEQASICDHSRIVIAGAVDAWIEVLQNEGLVEEHVCNRDAKQLAVKADREADFRKLVADREDEVLEDSYRSRFEDREELHVPDEDEITGEEEEE
ncbi:MAG: hypothetical protein ACREDR_00155 [Blastocatellia bacterium]